MDGMAAGDIAVGGVLVERIGRMMGEVEGGVRGKRLQRKPVQGGECACSECARSGGDVASGGGGEGELVKGGRGGLGRMEEH